MIDEMEIRLESFASILNYMWDNYCGQLDFAETDLADIFQSVEKGYPLHVSALQFSAYGDRLDNYQLTMYLASTPPKVVCNFIFPHFGIRQLNEIPTDNPRFTASDGRAVYITMTEEQVKALEAGETLEFPVQK